MKVQLLRFVKPFNHDYIHFDEWFIDGEDISLYCGLCSIGNIYTTVLWI